MNSAPFKLVRSLLLPALAASLTGCMVDMEGMNEFAHRDEIDVATDEAELAAPSVAPGILRAERAIPGQYIVVLNDGAIAAEHSVATMARELARSRSGKILSTYEHSIRGFAARMSEKDAADLLSDPRVAYVAEDGVVEISGSQGGAPWGLDRIDERDRRLNGLYTYHGTGAGVHAYIIDTGVRLSHQQFSGRMGTGFDAVSAGGNADDCNGHGTHVAGTVAGATYGVAKAATIHPVRVLGCNGSGSFSGVIAGVDWVANNHVKPAVANMSLGGGAYQPIDDAIARATGAGVTMVVAAGNENTDACTKSPARAASAITVGATAENDTRSSFSNYGSCVDIFAPGSNILSAYHTGDAATATLSGTSMAAPHVAGVAALYLESTPYASPAQVDARLKSAAIPGAVGNAGAGSPNRLLHNGLRNISLRASNGQYMVAEGGGDSWVLANRGAIGNWERFDIADLNGADLRHGDVINLRVSRGVYLAATNGGGGGLEANRTVAGSWETFRIWNLDGWSDFLTGDRVAIQSTNGHYLVAEGGGGGIVNANRGAVGPWETFVITVH